MDLDAPLVDWLMDADPALRWQVERDLVHASESQWRDTRARVAAEGFGARLLALQDLDGQWAGGAYFPRSIEGDPEWPEDAGQPWTATTWSLNTLRDWGLDAGALEGTAQELARNCRWEYEDRLYWDGEVDCCINAFTLANGAWLGADVSALVEWFAAHQMDDGGWNCEWVEGSVRSSFHSTINVLLGLLYYETRHPDPSLRELRRTGEEYLLERGLLRCQSSGELVGSWATEFAYPFRWPYSVLKAADYFRAASWLDGRAPDARLIDAIEVIRAARHRDGRWYQGARHAGPTWFEVDVAPGEASKWLTFFAVRVLTWWDNGRTD